ncbi:A24 family peptidase [Streptomyces sp. DSM 44917]|uniref:A24 family peptidase n=1 Tax=Streptomyces boetiae TaxID=3075541 RepID=A0ABU2LH37_9ACTN|nr:A24 family peptidase [Streptomyces sp. DSM 44917]MDT0310567.1 A24 family peptidase [Streptomyces sp. DSM 44917]
MSHPLLIAGSACFGALAGLLLPRAAYRLAVEPGEPWRSACPAGHPLSASGRAGRRAAWLGPARCAGCARGPDEPRYGVPAARPAALVAAGCALLAAAVGPRPELAVWLAAAPVLVLLATVDFAVQRLPDALTLPLAGAVAGGLGLAALADGAAGSWRRALLGGLVLGGVYLLLFLINPYGMGFGDVKLALSVGVALGWYGWWSVFLGTFAGFLLAAGYGLALVLAGRAGRRTTVPFGPFMALGAFAALLAAGLAA